VQPASRDDLPASNHFNLERHLIDRQTYRERRSAALAEWQFLMA
jgi:putative transposase